MVEDFERVNGRIVFYYDTTEQTATLREISELLNWANDIVKELKKHNVPVTLNNVTAFIQVREIEKKRESKSPVLAGGLPVKGFQMVHNDLALCLPDGEEARILSAEFDGMDKLPKNAQERLKHEIKNDFEELKGKCLSIRQKYRNECFNALSLSCICIDKDGEVALTKDFAQKAKENSAICAQDERAERLFLALNELTKSINDNIIPLMNCHTFLFDLFYITEKGLTLKREGINYNFI